MFSKCLLYARRLFVSCGRCLACFDIQVCNRSRLIPSVRRHQCVDALNDSKCQEVTGLFASFSIESYNKLWLRQSVSRRMLAF
jgi:hypothetical protein